MIHNRIFNLVQFIFRRENVVLLVAFSAFSLVFSPLVFAQVSSVQKSKAIVQADSLFNEAISVYKQKNLTQSAQFFEQACAIYVDELSIENQQALDCINKRALVYALLGRYKEAVKLNEETLPIRRKKLGVEHPDTLASMGNLAASYSGLERFVEALKLNEEVFSIRRNKQGAEHPDTLVSMRQLALDYSHLGRNAESLKLNEDIFELKRSKLGTDHISTLVSMKDLALSYRKLGRYAEALKLSENLLDLLRNKFGADHPDTLDSMNNIALNYDSLGRYVEAAKLNEETLALRRNKSGADHPKTLESMSNLAGNYRNVGRFGEALKITENVFAIRRNKLGADHPETVVSNLSLSLDYINVGRYAEALKLSEDLLALRRNKLGSDHPDTLASMSFLAAIYSKLGRHSESLKLEEETLAIARTKIGTEDPNSLTLVVMGGLAHSYSDLGRYAESLKLNEEIFSIRRAKLGVDHTRTLNIMAAIANDYNNMGCYAEALKMVEDVFGVTRIKLGADHPDTLISMHNLASIYFSLGRYADSAKINEEILAVVRRTLGANHPRMLPGMLSLVANYVALGRYAEALTLDEEALMLSRKIFDGDDSNTLRFMSAKADILGNVGRPLEALKLNEEIVGIRRSKLGADHPDTLNVMHNLETNYFDLGRYAEALTLGETILSFRRKKLGDGHPATFRSMNTLATTYDIENRHTEALALRRQLIDGIDRMAASLQTLTRDERSKALARYQEYYVQLAQSLIKTPTDFTEALTVTERGKARSLLEELTARHAISNSGIPVESANRLRELRSELEYLDGKLNTTSNEDARASLRAKIDAARIELDGLHKNLLAKNSRYAALSAVKIVTLEQGRALLPKNGVFVSWMFADNEKNELDGVALALSELGDLSVLKSTPGKAMVAHAESFRWLHALPDSQSFHDALQDTPLAAWQQNGVLYLGSPDKQPANSKPVSAREYMALRQTAIASHGQWLSDILLKPLSAQIDGATQWILSPDGVLSTIPWDTIPYNGKPLGEQKQLTLVQSLSVYKLLKDRENEYVRERHDNKTSSQGLLALGGAQYQTPKVNETCGVRSHTVKRAPNARNTLASAGADEYQSQNAYEQMRDLDWDNLPCTTGEVNTLNTIMGGKKLLGKNASETELRHLSEGGELAHYRYLHFAAHGYLNTSFPSLSALVLTKTGTEENNDGFITAGEWPAFKLKSDLLVMSACETGLGKVINGEGVQGLPYALYVAGNRDTLLTLWQVSDGGTAVFMKIFWSKVKTGKNHSQALMETKREMQRGDAGKAYTDPYYWAPFVLYGVQGG